MCAPRRATPGSCTPGTSQTWSRAPGRAGRGGRQQSTTRVKVAWMRVKLGAGSRCRGCRHARRQCARLKPAPCLSPSPHHRCVQGLPTCMNSSLLPPFIFFTSSGASCSGLKLLPVTCRGREWGRGARGRQGDAAQKTRVAQHATLHRAWRLLWHAPPCARPLQTTPQRVLPWRPSCEAHPGGPAPPPPGRSQSPSGHPDMWPR